MTTKPQIQGYSEPIVVESKFRRTANDLFKGEELYAFALFCPPAGPVFNIAMTDDAIGHDMKPNDGIYTCGLHVEEVLSIILKAGGQAEGTWRIYIFAQDVNGATPDMLPEVAAKEVGGYMIASAVEVTFDPSLPCPLRTSASVNVIL